MHSQSAKPVNLLKNFRSRTPSAGGGPNIGVVLGQSVSLEVCQFYQSTASVRITAAESAAKSYRNDVLERLSDAFYESVALP